MPLRKPIPCGHPLGPGASTDPGKIVGVGVGVGVRFARSIGAVGGSAAASHHCSMMVNLGRCPSRLRTRIWPLGMAAWIAADRSGHNPVALR